MSVEILRRAAAAMRSTAEAATNAQWWPYFCPKHLGSSDGDWVVDSGPTFICSTQIGNERGQGDAEHIASWHPAVALAVADLLDRHVDRIDGTGFVGHAHEGLLAVARAYLREA